MQVVLLCHALASCWNHGNAHFLRGIARDLTERGHEVRALAPADGWSRMQLAAEDGAAALEAWRGTYPELTEQLYEPARFDADRALDGADLVIVHEWTDPAIVRAVARHRRQGGRFTLLFHDTHHRALSDRDAIARLPLDGFDGVLAFGQTLRERYLSAGWASRVWVWHEAADTTVFRPMPAAERDGDIVWIGNWGDEERSDELRRFLLRPAKALGLEGAAFGVRYPEAAKEEVEAAGLAYRGWLPNHAVPATFGRFTCTVHVPRRPYVRDLPGIPTIRVFEALACGIPLVTAPWEDVEGLFGPGCMLRAADEAQMTRHLRDLIHDPGLRASLVGTGLSAIRAGHTCRHRVGELLAIVATLHASPPSPVGTEALCA